MRGSVLFSNEGTIAAAVLGGPVFARWRCPMSNNTAVVGDDAISPDDFEEVVAEHWGAVRRLLHTLTGDMHDTEDLTQETFLRALNRFSSFRPGTNMRTWLLRIASNAFFDVHRRRQLADFRELV